MTPRYTNPARVQQQARMQATRRSEEARRRVQARLLREQDRMARGGPDHLTLDEESVQSKG